MADMTMRTMISSFGLALCCSLILQTSGQYMLLQSLRFHCIPSFLLIVCGVLRYIVSDMLGQGTFGQVAKCICQQTGEVVAVKVIKNQTAFYHQARVEVGVLQYLNKVSDPDDQHYLVRMHAFFVFKEHLCLVFELLSLNLYELIKQNQFRGLSMRLLRIFLSQVSPDKLHFLCVLIQQLCKAGWHCVLNPTCVVYDANQACRHVIHVACSAPAAC